MPKDQFSYLPEPKTKLSNHQWAKLIRDAVEDLNALICEAPARDVTVQLEQKLHSVHEHPVLTIKHLAENL